MEEIARTARAAARARGRQAGEAQRRSSAPFDLEMMNEVGYCAASRITRATCRAARLENRRRACLTTCPGRPAVSTESSDHSATGAM